MEIYNFDVELIDYTPTKDGNIATKKYVDSADASLQTQIDGKAASSHTHTVSNVTDLTATAAEINVLDGITASTAELNYTDGVTSNIQTQLDSKQARITGGATTITSDDLSASKALVSDTSGKVAASSVTAAELGVLSGITASTAELNYTDGVISNIQTQIDGKAASSHTHTVPNITDLTATAAEINVLDGITASTTELNYTDGVTSNIQTQLDGKQTTITGGATTITSADLTVSKALVSNSSGKVAASAVTATELGYLSGVASNVQTQIDGKAASSHTHTVSNITDLTATAAEINVLDGITASTAELNYTDGVTSNIQTQLDGKAPLASPALTGTPTAPTATSGTSTTQIATTAFVQSAISSVGSSNYPYETLTATWSETIAALTTVTKTISHSLGAIPSKVKMFFVASGLTAMVEIDYKSGSYNYTMEGTMYNGSSNYLYRKWKKPAITDNYLFGLLNSSPVGSPALGSYNLRLSDITLSNSQISIPIYNSITSSQTLSSSVTVEVYK